MDPMSYHVMLSVIKSQLNEICPGTLGDMTLPEEKELIAEALRISGGEQLTGRLLTNPIPLESIFNHLHLSHGCLQATVDENGQFAGYGPVSNVSIWDQIGKWKREVKRIPLEPAYANAMLELVDDCFGVISAPSASGRHDVSLFHEIKTVAAIAACMNAGKTEGRGEKPFALFSLDFSGIQSFIYTITSSGALRALRARSLYLSVMTEYISDLILEKCGFTRANLIYAGGGRAHFLLPSSPNVIQKAESIVDKVNLFLRENFGASLFLASGWTEASTDALTSNHGKKNSFSQLFYETSQKISARKLTRYSYGELVEMNSADRNEGERECAICGNTSHLVQWKELCLCRSCAQLERFSAGFGDDTKFLCVLDETTENGLSLPSPDGKPRSLVAGDLETAKRAVLTYAVNHSTIEVPDAVRISISNHQARREYGKPASFEELAKDSEGIRRLGVFRGDVDNLGVLFANGFTMQGDDRPYAACTLTHYSALSSALTWFFQRRLDRILEEDAVNPLLLAKEKAAGVSVVYAGGDDVFLIGSWNDVLDAGIRIQRAFNAYTGGMVTMSAGYGAFGEHTPVPIMAETVADLEADAKQLDGKNGISLFGSTVYENGGMENHCYHWDYFYKTSLAYG